MPRQGDPRRLKPIATLRHPNTHFDKNNRFVDGNEPVEQEALYEAGNLLATLQAGFTTGADSRGAGGQNRARCD